VSTSMSRVARAFPWYSVFGSAGDRCLGARLVLRRRGRRARDSSSAGSAAGLAEAPRIEFLEPRQLLTAVLSPISDTFVRNNAYADTNFGAAPLLFVKNASGGDTRVAFVKFDIGAVSNITSATLRLTGQLPSPE